MNLYEKIQAVANEIRSIEKDMSVGTGNSQYKAVSDLSVTIAVKDAENKHRLVSVPVKQEIVHQEVIRIVERETEKIRYSFIIKMTTRIVDLDNTADFIEIESFGHGLDSGDKGFGKASTYARKYALLNAYKIATGEDPDKEPSENQKTLTKDDIKNATFDYLYKNNDYMISVLKHFNISEISDMNKDQIRIVYSNLKKKNIL